MKRALFFLLSISLMSALLISCAENGKQNSTNTSIEVKVDMYDPGDDWNLVWSDEFEGESLDENNWNYQVEEAGRFNDEWQRYTNSSENAYVEDGMLIIKAIHESDVHGMDQYTSARLNTANKQTWKYGKIVARIKLPYGNGMWPAFWMLGANVDENGGDTPWPQSGEIDILELYGSINDSVVEANLHYADENGLHASAGAKAFHLKEGRFADDFHVFELDWDENRIVWLVDGVEYCNVPITADDMSEFHEEFFILFNIAVGNQWAGRPDAESVFPQYMYVDWVRVYQKEAPNSQLTAEIAAPPQSSFSARGKKAQRAGNINQLTIKPLRS